MQRLESRIYQNFPCHQQKVWLAKLSGSEIPNMTGASRLYRQAINAARALRTLDGSVLQGDFPGAETSKNKGTNVGIENTALPTRQLFEASQYFPSSGTNLPWPTSRLKSHQLSQPPPNPTSHYRLQPESKLTPRSAVPSSALLRQRYITSTANRWPSIGNASDDHLKDTKNLISHEDMPHVANEKTREAFTTSSGHNMEDMDDDSLKQRSSFKPYLSLASEEAQQYIAVVQHAFREDPKRFRAFLFITDALERLNEEYVHGEGLLYEPHPTTARNIHIEPGTQGRKDIYLRYSEIMNRVCTLFSGKQELLDDFERFFPPAYRRVGSKGENGSEQQNIGKGTSTNGIHEDRKKIVCKWFQHQRF